MMKKIFKMEKSKKILYQFSIDRNQNLDTNRFHWIRLNSTDTIHLARTEFKQLLRGKRRDNGTFLSF